MMTMASMPEDLKKQIHFMTVQYWSEKFEIICSDIQVGPIIDTNYRYFGSRRLPPDMTIIFLLSLILRDISFILVAKSILKLTFEQLQAQQWSHN
jgi:hypothetical protein